MVNKKAEMTIATIVAIALAVVVLIFLIYGFSTGWGSLWDRITNFGGIDQDNSNDNLIRCQILEGSGGKNTPEWNDKECTRLLLEKCKTNCGDSNTPCQDTCIQKYP